MVLKKESDVEGKSCLWFKNLIAAFHQPRVKRKGTEKHRNFEKKRK